MNALPSTNSRVSLSGKDDIHNVALHDRGDTSDSPPMPSTGIGMFDSKMNGAGIFNRLALCGVKLRAREQKKNESFILLLLLCFTSCEFERTDPNWLQSLT